MSTIVNGRRAFRLGVTGVLFAVAALAAGDRAVRAQTSSDASKDGHATIALEGYCPVCIVQMKKWVKGGPQHQATFNGKTYWFPGAKQRQMFLANPTKYVPVLNGDCAVCLAKMGKRVPGNIRHSAFHDGRLFLFPAEAQQKEFLANVAAYANIDRVTIEGTSGCAACDHGVVPVGASEVMGLAVTATDGKVYLVEDAHKLYPDLYRRRFEGLRLAVTGTELKRKGNIVWIQPSQLDLLNK